MKEYFSQTKFSGKHTRLRFLIAMFLSFCFLSVGNAGDLNSDTLIVRAILDSSEVDVPISSVAGFQNNRVTALNFSSTWVDCGGPCNPQGGFWGGVIIKKIPGSIAGLDALTSLTVSGGPIKVLLSDSISLIGGLESLTLTLIGIDTFPSWIPRLSRLTNLNLWGNFIAAVPNNILLDTALYTFNISYNGLQTFPACVLPCKHLSTLDLTANNIQDLPTTISSLIELKNLYVQWNKLTLIPKDIAGLEKLEQLRLSDNPLVALPDSLCDLPRLSQLFVNDCKLCSVDQRVTLFLDSIDPGWQQTQDCNNPVLPRSTAGRVQSANSINLRLRDPSNIILDYSGATSTMATITICNCSGRLLFQKSLWFDGYEKKLLGLQNRLPHEMLIGIIMKKDGKIETRRQLILCVP